MTTPWKWDVTIYDRPYWRSTPNNHHQLRLLPDNKGAPDLVLPK